MKVIVYFETLSSNYAEIVAQFANEQMYIRCLPQLEKLAREQNMVVTESMREDEDIQGMSKDDRAEFDYWQLHCN